MEQEVWMEGTRPVPRAVVRQLGSVRWLCPLSPCLWAEAF